MRLEHFHVKQELKALLIQNNMRLVQNIPAHQYIQIIVHFQIPLLVHAFWDLNGRLYSVRYGGNTKTILDYYLTVWKEKMSETEKVIRACRRGTCLQRNWPPPLTWTWTSDESCLKVGETFCLYRRCDKRTFGCHCKADLWI